MVAPTTQTSGLWDMQFTEWMGVRIVCDKVDVACQFFFMSYWHCDKLHYPENIHSFTLDYNKFEYGAKKNKSQQLQKSDGIVASHLTTVPRKPRLTSSRCHQLRCRPAVPTVSILLASENNNNSSPYKHVPLFTATWHNVRSATAVGYSKDAQGRRHHQVLLTKTSWASAVTFVFALDKRNGKCSIFA